MWVGEIWRAAWFDMKLKKTFELLMKHWDLMRVFFLVCKCRWVGIFLKVWGMERKTLETRVEHEV